MTRPIEKWSSLPPSQQIQILPASEPIGRRVALGAAWMITLRITLRLVGLTSTLVLVRLLAPQDFGLVAMASVAYGMLDSLSESSFQLALIQMKAPEPRHYDSVWTLGVLRGATIAVIMALCAPLVAAGMNEPRIQLLIYVLAISPIIQGFENVTLVKWQRDLRFDRVFWYQVFSKITGSCAVVCAAIAFENYWALIVAPLIVRAVMVPLSYYLSPYSPRFTTSAWRELFHFSKWLMVSNILTMVEAYSIVFLIGRFFGPRSLGLFQMAMEIAHLPASEVAAPIRQPMYVGFVKVMDQTDALRRQALEGLGLVLMLVVPLSVGLAVTADLVTPIFLGSKWTNATPIIAIGALAALIDNIGYFTHNLYIVRHAQARFAVILGVMQVVRMALAIPIGAAYGIVGVAVVILVTSMLNCFTWFMGLSSLLRVKLSDLLRVSWRITTSAIVMAIGVRGLSLLWPYSGTLFNQASHLAVACFTGAVLYSSVLVALWMACGQPPGSEADVFHNIHLFLTRLRHIRSRE